MARIAFIDVTVTVSYGGLQTTVWRLAHMLSTMGHDVSVFGGEGDIPTPSDCAQVTVKRFPFLPRERAPRLGHRFGKLVERASFARHARHAVRDGDFDWVIVDKPYDFLWPWIMPARRNTRFGFVSGGTDFFAGDRWLSRRIDAWLTCSHFNAAQLRTRYKRQANVIFNGVDTKRFAASPVDPATRERLGVPANAVLFVFSGRLIGLKGVHVTLAAMAESAMRDLPVYLLIVGDGPERARLAEQTRRLGIENRVVFHEPVPQTELPALYNAADCGIFPSLADEAFGISIAEAMSCGKPVVASYVGGIPEVVGNEESCGLLISPGRPPELAKAMQRLAADAALRVQMGAAARSRVVNNFTWAASARRLAEVLELSASTQAPKGATAKIG